MENKLYKLLKKIHADFLDFFDNSLNGNNEVLDKCVNKDKNGNFVEDTQHWDKMLVRCKNLQGLVDKLRARLMTVNEVSDFKAARRMMNDKIIVWYYEIFLDFEDNCNVHDTRLKCIKTINRTYETAMELIDEAENQRNEENGEGKEQLTQLKTKLSDHQRVLLFDLLVKGGFIPDENKDCFIWALGKSEEKQPEHYKPIKWNKSKEAFAELLTVKEYSEHIDGKRTTKPLIPIFETLSNQNKRDIEKLFVKNDKPLDNLKTPKKDSYSGDYANICNIINQIQI